MKFRIGLGLLLALATFVAAAAGPAGVRKRAEASMLVTGWIDIGKDGSVSAHRLDQPDKLPPEVVELIGNVVPGWRFEPIVVAGRNVNARTRMSARIILAKNGENNYVLRMGSASFGDEKPIKGEAPTILGQMTPPNYPRSAYMAGVQGTAYLMLKVDRQGVVQDVVDEQVNLSVVGDDQQMKKGRDLLAKAAKAAVRKWRFDVPVRGAQAGEPFWSMRVPVAFKLCDDSDSCGAAGEPAYGRWEGYIPGPKNRVPWVGDEVNRQSPDAMIAGSFYPVGSGPRLLTPPEQG